MALSMIAKKVSPTEWAELARYAESKGVALINFPKGMGCDRELIDSAAKAGQDVYYSRKADGSLAQGPRRTAKAAQFNGLPESWRPALIAECLAEYVARYSGGQIARRYPLAHVARTVTGEPDITLNGNAFTVRVATANGTQVFTVRVEEQK